MKTLHKILPYLVVIIVAVVATKIVDGVTDTSDQEVLEEKKELLMEIEQWRTKYKRTQLERNVLQQENDLLLKEIEQYEIENDTVVSLIRDANDQRDFTRLDSLGDDLINRLRRRRQP